MPNGLHSVRNETHAPSTRNVHQVLKDMPLAQAGVQVSHKLGIDLQRIEMKLRKLRQIGVGELGIRSAIVINAKPYSCRSKLTQ